jgi:hypothetical protein
MKSQSIAYLLNEIEYVYWLLDLGDEMHLIWDLWRSGLQECKGNGFFGEIGRGGQRFLGGSKLKNSGLVVGQLPLTKYSSPKRLAGRRMLSTLLKGIDM